MSTTTLPLVGSKVRIAIIPGSADAQRLSGRVATVFGRYSADQPLVTVQGVPGPHQGGSWVINGWDVLPALPEIGTIVRALEVPGYHQYDGKDCTVTEVGYAGSDCLLRGEFTSPQKPDDSESLVFRKWAPLPTEGDRVRHRGTGEYPGFSGETGTVLRDDKSGLPLKVRIDGQHVGDDGVWLKYEDVDVIPSDGQTLTVSSPEGREAELLGQVEELRRQLERANQRVSEYSERAGKWERDFGRYANRVKDEAIERDWCEEYERVMSNIEDDFEIAEITKRVRLVEKRVRIRGEVYRDVTVWVEEGDDAGDSDNWYESDDLDSKCSDDFMSDQIDSEYNNYGFDEIGITVLR